MKTSKKQQSQTTRIAYSYRRWSDIKQTKGHSGKRQKSPVQAVCDENGWTLSPLSAELEDAGVGAFRGKHKLTGKLGYFLRLMDAGTVKAGSVLILEDLDRLTREELSDAEDLVKKIIRGGVDIYVIRNRRLYTRQSLNNPMELLEVIWLLYLGHQESAKKAKRLKDWWQDRRGNLKDNPLPHCPGWVEWDGKKYVAIPERKAIVQRVFKMVQEGQGIVTICRTLNGEGVPFWGYKPDWNKSYVATLLHNRQVLGEFQPHTWDAGTRKAAGSVVKLYPEIIAEPEFQKVQRIVRARKRQTGPTANECRNLFTGLLYGKNGTLTLQRRVNRGKVYQYLGQSKVASRGIGQGVWLRYDDFERHMLAWLVELTPADLVGDKKATARVRKLETEIAEKERRIGQIKTKLDEGDNFTSLLDTMTKLERQKKALLQELETVKAGAAAPTVLKGVQSVIAVLEQGGTPARVKLKTVLKDIVERIDIEVRHQYVYTAIRFTSGTVRRVWFNLYTEESGVWSDGTFPAGDIDVMKTVGGS